MSNPIDNVDLPRERMLRRGTEHVGDEDLIAVILGTAGTSVAAALVKAAGGMVAASRASPRELAAVRGVGEARAARIAAAFELGRRAVETAERRMLLETPEDAVRCVKARLAGVQQERFFVLGVDVRGRLIEIVEVGRGALDSVEVHPREVFRPLIRMAAAGAVLVHNHPSGDPTPSDPDVELTRRMREIGSLLGIPIIDHVVIGGRSHRSIGEWLIGA
jgi:DNA repair protein RadC